MRSKLCLLAFISLVAFYSCEDETTETILKGKYTKGVFVVNEGNHKKDNADISFFLPDSSKVYNEVFYSANSEALGDVAQSVAANGDNYFVVVNNSNKIEVVNKTDFTRVKTIAGLVQPRFIAFSGNKAFVTQWGKDGINGAVVIIDLATYTVQNTVPVGAGAEKMVKVNDDLYISNSGGYGSDSTISIFNIPTGQVTKSIKVGYNPKSMVLDKNNKLWVLCGGRWKMDYSGLEKAGSLVRINLADNSVEKSFSFDLGFSQPSSLNINPAKDKLIYLYDNKVFEMSVADQALPLTPKINRGFYNLAIDPASGQVYGTDPKTYVVSGNVVRYSPSFAVIDSFKVGRVPGEIFFNN